MSKKLQKELEDLKEIIFLCECVLRDAETETDYQTAEKQLFETEVQLQELELKIQKKQNKFKNSAQVSR